MKLLTVSALAAMACTAYAASVEVEQQPESTITSSQQQVDFDQELYELASQFGIRPEEVDQIKAEAAMIEEEMKAFAADLQSQYEQFKAENPELVRKLEDEAAKQAAEVETLLKTIESAFAKAEEIAKNPEFQELEKQAEAKAEDAAKAYEAMLDFVLRELGTEEAIGSVPTAEDVTAEVGTVSA